MAQEKANNFTREDVLRELELLPVWQLRVPVTQTIALPSSATTAEPEVSCIAELAPKVLTVAETRVEHEEQIEPVIHITPKLRHLASEDGQWIFVLADVELSVEQEHLLANIFKAMQLKIKATTTSEYTAALIKSTQPKLLFSMGESAMQGLLQSNSSLQDMRGKAHEYEGVKLVATYDVEHLLNNLTDKAKAWADMRFAMQLVQDLNN